MSKPTASATPGRTVLRDATLAPQTHLLRRPGAGPSPLPALVASDSGTVSALHARPERRAVAPSAEQEARLREKYQQGHAAGWIEGQQAERREQTSAQLKAGYQQGLEQGRAEAARTAGSAKQQSLAVLEGLLVALPPQIEERLAAAEDDMVALCFEAVVKIIGACATTPAGIRALLEQGLGRMRAQRLAALHLHPQDARMLREDADIANWLRQYQSHGPVQLVADPLVRLGGAILRSPEGSLDARLDTQLAALRALLEQQRAGGGQP